MTRDFAFLATRRKEGGDKVATLLFVIAALAAAAVFAISSWFSSPADATIAHVPETASVYLHARGRGAGNFLTTMLPSAPSVSVSADEIGIYAAVDDSGAQLWHTVVAWRAPRRPSDEDLRTLETVRAIPLDDRSFLIGDDAAHRLSGTRLSDDGDVVRALERAAGRSTMQAFLSSKAFGKEGATAFVGVVAPRDDGFLVDLLPLPVQTSSAVSGPSRPLDADVSVTAGPGTIDLSTILFGKTSNGYLASSVVRAIGNAAYLLHIDLAPVSGMPAIVLRLPTTPAEGIRLAMHAYATASNPLRRPLKLPDGERVTELLVPPSDGDIIVFADGPDGAASVRSDGDGTIIAIPPNTPISRKVEPLLCPGQQGSAMILKERAASALLSKIGLNPTGMRRLEVIGAPNGGVRICGYRNDAVEN